MPPRPKEKPLKKKPKHSTTAQRIHPSPTTFQIQVHESFVEANSQVRFCCGQELSGCEPASVTCQTHSCHLYLVLQGEQENQLKFSSADHNLMADSANGKLEEAQKVEEVEAEAVRDIAIDDYSVEHQKKTEEPTEAAEESPQVEEAALVVEEKEEEVPISVVVDDVKPEEKEEEVKQYAPSVDETDESSPVVEDVVSKPVDEEKTISELVSNGAEELALPYLSEEKTLSDAVSNGAEELTLPYLSEEISNVVPNGSEETKEPYLEEEKVEEVVAPPVEDVVSKRIEEVNLPVVEEISTGEPSDAAYKETSQSVVDESLKPSPVVPVPTPVESTEDGKGYGKREMPESVGNPSIVSVTRSPLQPTSWRSCCGLFEVLRRSDR